VRFTGGIVLNGGWWRLSSRDAVRPGLVATAAALIYAWRWRSSWRHDLRALIGHPLPRWIAVCSAGLAVAVGVGAGTFYAGGADASGYVSQAQMWLRGELTWPAPAWVEGAPWDDAGESASPVGYKPTPNSHIIAPTYAPGLPMLMALFQLAAGPDAVFLVVPVFGVLAIWATYLLGRQIGGAWTGAAACVLVISSPVFLFMVTQPMSDVPVTACWTLALAASARPGISGAVGAGVLTSAAVLIRPNLAPLAGITGLLVMTEGRALTWRRAGPFALALAPAVLVIATLNQIWYGSPMLSGYGSFESLYRPVNVGPNVVQYATWMLSAHTPLIALCLVAPIVLVARSPNARTVLVTCVFPLAVWVPYFAYTVFDTWTYLRFMLPSFPVLFAGLAAVLLSARGTRTFHARAATATIVAVLALYGWFYAYRNGLFSLRPGEQRYARAVDYVRSLPAATVAISNLHSGTLRHYTGRDIVRWEVLDPESLDVAIAYLRGRNLAVYAVLDRGEVEAFKRYFAGQRTAETLDQARWADLDGVLVYRLSATD
jgi:hypothetical protein